MNNYSPTEYTMCCVATGEVFDDEGWSLDYPTCGEPSLIRTQYHHKRLTIYDDEGLYRYRDWLPMKRQLQCRAAPKTYKSVLGEHFDLFLTALNIFFHKSLEE